VPVLPPDADARGMFLEHLLDHSCPARLRHLFGLDDDPVSGVRPHLCLILLFRLSRALGEASATFLILSAVEGVPPGRRFAGIGNLEADVARPPTQSLPHRGRKRIRAGGSEAIRLGSRSAALDATSLGVVTLLGA
jgi:hypothetical protein